MGCRNSATFDYADKVISISEIDTGDDTFRLSLRTDPDALVVSIRAVGLINPPVLRQREDLRYQIVCGFRRVMACKALGWHEVKAKVLKEGSTEIDSFKLAILDNRSHRQLNVVEQAQGIQKLSCHLLSRNRLQMLSSLLGFPENKRVLEKIEALSRLPGVIHSGVMDEIVSFEAAVDLSEFSHEDALSLFERLKVLKLSQNKQREIIALVQEIAIREDIQPREVLESKEIRTILDRPELNRNEKGSKVRAYLKRRRFPALTIAEERFSRELRALKLNEDFHMTAPAYFEGGPYTLRMTFKTVRDFDERLKALDAVAKKPALKRLLQPFGDK
jgi:hypothetical protein